MKLIRSIVAAALCSSCLVVSAELPDLEQIMADPDWIGNAPEQAWWSDDGKAVNYRQKRAGENYREVFRVYASGGEPELLSPAQVTRSSGYQRVYNIDRTNAAWVEAGDVYTRDLDSGVVTQLTNTVVEETDPMFLVDGSTVAFKREGQYFLFESVSGVTRQLSDIRFEDNPYQPSQFDPLRDQQRRSSEALVEESRRKQALEASQRRYRDAGRQYPLQPIYLGKHHIELSRSLSPDGRHLLLVLKDAQWEAKQKHRTDQMPNYVTENGTVDTRFVRERVGRDLPPNPVYLVVDLATGQSVNIDTTELPGRSSDPLKKLRKKAIAWHVQQGAPAAAVEKQLAAPQLRDIEHHSLHWSPRGDQLAIMAISQDHKDRWLFTVDPDTGALKNQHRATDEAWVNWQYNEFGWLPDSRSLWFMSEQTGYNHLYVKSLKKSRARQLTRGDFVVREPQVNADGTRAWLVANRSHPGEWEVYSVPLGGGELKQLSSLGGVTSFSLSPDADQLLLSHSYIDRHPDLYVQPSDGSAAPQQITDTVSDAFKAIDWVMPDIVKVPSSHTDRPIYSKLYLPPDHDPTKTYPAVMFVHGAGYTQNAHKGWPYYFREFMFHTVLANAGYVVLDMDYRASEGYGRDWRTTIYRNMGHPELEDYLDGIDWLAQTQGVDSTKVGIYGGSYGGFMTFMALFRAPDAFAAGAALRPVVDWMHYEQGYTAAILNSPDVDPWAYQKSSPINHVKGLKKPLLIATGMQDDNVFFQDSVILVQRLLELKKEDWEIAVYPLDGHGFHLPESWLDEYRRIYKLMEENLK